MVDIGDIKSVFDELVIGFDGKCLSLARIREKLSSLSRDEKIDLLSDKMTEAEKEWYNGLLHRLDVELEYLPSTIEHLEYEIEDAKKNNKQVNIDYYTKRLEHVYDRQHLLEDWLFDYEKRIYNGYTIKNGGEIPKYNIDDYSEDPQDHFMNHNLIDKLQQAQIDNQSNVTFTQNELNCLRYYFGDGAKLINSLLNNGRKASDLSPAELEIKQKLMKSVSRYLTSAINKTNGLEVNTILYHGGEFDISLLPGDKLKLKGYTSASFNSNVAREFSNYSSVPSEKFYVYRFLTPKSTKGVCANDTKQGTLTTHILENEYLLDKGLTGTILEVDVENHIVTVLVE